MTSPQRTNSRSAEPAQPLLRHSRLIEMEGAMHVWVCRDCGKRSYAKRDPIAHERAVKTETDYGMRRDYVWCGPFDRYVATLDTSKPQRDASTMPHLGTPSRKPDEWEEDPNAGIEVPF